MFREELRLTGALKRRKIERETTYVVRFLEAPEALETARSAGEEASLDSAEAAVGAADVTEAMVSAIAAREEKVNFIFVNKSEATLLLLL
jgi:hypothetical protein